MIGIIPHVVDAYMLEKYGNGARVDLRERVGLPVDHVSRLTADYDDVLCRAIVAAATATDLMTTYRSPNWLGVLYAALVAKIAERYGERAGLGAMDGTPDGPFCRFEMVLKPLGVVARKEAACAG